MKNICVETYRLLCCRPCPRMKGPRAANQSPMVVCGQSTTPFQSKLFSFDSFISSISTITLSPYLKEISVLFFRCALLNNVMTLITEHNIIVIAHFLILKFDFGVLNILIFFTSCYFETGQVIMHIKRAKTNCD